MTGATHFASKGISGIGVVVDSIYMAGFDLLTTAIVATAVFSGVLLILAFVPYLRGWRITYSSRSARVRALRAVSDQVDLPLNSLAVGLGVFPTLAVVAVTIASLFAVIAIGIPYVAQGDYGLLVATYSWAPDLGAVLLVGVCVELTRRIVTSAKPIGSKGRTEVSFLYNLIFFMGGAWAWFGVILTILFSGATYYTYLQLSPESLGWLAGSIISGLSALALFSISAQARVQIENQAFVKFGNDKNADVIVEVTVSAKGKSEPRHFYGRLLGIGPDCIIEREDKLVEAIRWSDLLSIAAADVRLTSDA
jgi:hypothetical protein